MRQRGRLSFSGDIFARHPFAESLGAVLQHAANQKVIGINARMRSVADGFPLPETITADLLDLIDLAASPA